MAEYIEREALKNSLCDVCNDEYSDTPCEPNDCFIIRVINEQPTADVVEVRHGKWDDNIIGFCNVCMECGAIVDRTAIKNNSGELNYCPNCGARMDGNGEGE